MVEWEQGGARKTDDGRDEAAAVDMASPTAAADDAAYRRLMALGRGVPADFDEALAELAKQALADPVWIPKRVVVDLHDAELARPENLHAYGEPDLPALAAAYAFGLAKDHAFVDGNKRASLTTCVLFLRANGLDLRAPTADTVTTWQALAAGTLGEAELAAWLRARVVPLG